MGYQEGQERLTAIKTFLQHWGAADRDTLEQLFFPSRARAQAVLTNFAKKKVLSRYRDEQYIYFLPGYKGNIMENRLRAKFYASRKFVSSWWKITYVDCVYVCINTYDYKAVNIQPLFSDREQPGQGNAVVTVGYGNQDYPRADTLKEAIKHFYKPGK